jgi:hypothetical protein
MRYHQRIVRTTLDLDDDVLAAAKDLARRQQVTAGQLISGLLRERFSGVSTAAVAAEPAPNSAGFRPLPSRGALVTNDLVNRLRDGEGV